MGRKKKTIKDYEKQIMPPFMEGDPSIQSIVKGLLFSVSKDKEKVAEMAMDLNTCVNNLLKDNDSKLQILDQARALLWVKGSLETSKQAEKDLARAIRKKQKFKKRLYYEGGRIQIRPKRMCQCELIFILYYLKKEEAKNYTWPKAIEDSIEILQILDLVNDDPFSFLKRNLDIFKRFHRWSSVGKYAMSFYDVETKDGVKILSPVTKNPSREEPPWHKIPKEDWIHFLKKE